MSAGRSMRRGYYGVVAPLDSLDTSEQERSGRLLLILLAGLTVLIVLVQSDRVFASAIGTMLGELWTDISAFAKYVLGR